MNLITVNVGLLCEYSVFGSTNVYVHSLGSVYILRAVISMQKSFFTSIYASGHRCDVPQVSLIGYNVSDV